jgi:hypothetical protein
MRRRLLTVTAALACSAGAGCKGDGASGGAAPRGRTEVEAKVAADVARATGAKIAEVRCPPGPPPATCEATLAGGGAVPLAITADGDGTAWALDGVVIATAPLVAQITEELAGLGVTAKVDCGPALRPAARGARLDCALEVGGAGAGAGAGPVRGAAWATITDDDGGYRLEVALDPAVVAARTADVDDAALTRTSAALDRDDAEGDGAPDDGDGDAGAGEGEGASGGLADAGVAPPDGAVRRGSGT